MFPLSDVRDNPMGSRGQGEEEEEESVTACYTDSQPQLQCQNCGHRNPYLATANPGGILASNSSEPSRARDTAVYNDDYSPPSPQRSRSPHADLENADSDLHHQWWWLEKNAAYEEARRTKSMRHLRSRSDNNLHVDLPAKDEMTRQNERRTDKMKRKASRGFSISSLIAPTKRLRHNVGSISESVKDFICRKDSALPGRVGSMPVGDSDESVRHDVDNYSDLAPLCRQERQVTALVQPLPCYSASDSEGSTSPCASIGIATPVSINACSRGVVSANYIGKTSAYPSACGTGSLQWPQKHPSAMQLRPYAPPLVAPCNSSIAYSLQKPSKQDHMQDLAVAVERAHVSGSFGEDARETRFRHIATGQDERKPFLKGIVGFNRSGGGSDKPRSRDFRGSFTHLAGMGTGMHREAKRKGRFFSKGEPDSAGFVDHTSRVRRSEDSVSPHWPSDQAELSSIDFLRSAIQQTGLGLSI
ncbi:hypothetical protein K431DRAFT_283281 [Polychaeton citri CBS 116435]|uniref:Uncharacterized protein n=1 Tax=Polychaeton citri CBS 116435 TaxID=1314669 RepID=A0A9P4QCC9_9PEZI|nr:hypothetical protein K431DRAFT_283281 [Polychaeton citri CBS 116435]